jgi:hypothetical protein
MRPRLAPWAAGRNRRPGATSGVHTRLAESGIPTARHHADPKVRDLRRFGLAGRGLGAPQLIVADGASGLRRSTRTAPHPAISAANPAAPLSD